MKIETVIEKTTKFKAADGSLHESARLAEIKNVYNALKETCQLEAILIAGTDCSDIAAILVDNKSTFGPLLHVPKKRAPKAVTTPPEAGAAKGKKGGVK